MLPKAHMHQVRICTYVSTHYVSHTLLGPYE